MAEEDGQYIEYEEALFSKQREEFILSIMKAYNNEPVLRIFVGELDEGGEKANGIYFDLNCYDVFILAGILSEIAKEMFYELRTIDLRRKFEDSAKDCENDHEKHIYFR